MNQKENQNFEPYNDEITLRELILKLQEFWRELWRNWWLIGLFCIPTVGYFLYKTITHVPEYTAEVRFLVEGQGGGNAGGLSGLLGSFGIRSGGGKTNPYKILEVAKSKRLVGKVLFDESITKNTKIANIIIDEYKLREKWAENNPEMEGFYFTGDNIIGFDTIGRKAFLTVYRMMVGSKKNQENALVSINLNEDTGIFTIDAKTKDESLSLDISNKLYEYLKDFFERQILKEQIKSRDVLQAKADSIDELIDQKLIAIARFDDSSRGLISNESEIRKEKLMVEVEGLTNAYVQMQKSLTIADYELQNQKPLFLTIDRPYAPIEPSRESLLSNLIIGLFLGGFLGVVFVVSRKIYRDAMEEE